ncbi:hypothetical protein HN827_00785 [archaeon]|nr:hypothetical protein [archaeon]MBT7391335.1 hypothetical protein [archaeon]
MNKKITRYVNQLKKSGHSQKQIIKNLKRVGWYEEYNGNPRKLSSHTSRRKKYN